MDAPVTSPQTVRNGSSGPDVERLQRLLTLLGDYEGSIDGKFGPVTESAVRSFQARAGIAVDGIAGPITWAKLTEVALDAEEPLTSLRHAWRERDAAELDVTPPEEAPIPEGPAPAGAPTSTERTAWAAQALARAEEEWGRPVAEPNGTGWERIDTYIRGPEGLGWDWEDAYVRNRQFAWCGAFAAFCLAGAGLGADVRKRVMPSTYRLYTWAKGSRLMPIESAAPGDIVIVGPAGGKVWGNHITLCERAEDGYVLTFEGNARGNGPDGTTYEGVVRQRRPLPERASSPRDYRVMHVIRFASEDFA